MLQRFRVTSAVLILDQAGAAFDTSGTLSKELGCDLAIAQTRGEARALLATRQFAAMLLDVESGGYEIARDVRSVERTRGVPIIFLTEFGEPSRKDLEEYLRGPADFLFKPISARLLVSKIRLLSELVEKSRLLREAKRDLELAQSQVVQATKMAALGELTASIAHEINNPLSFATSHLKTARAALDSIFEQVDVLSEGATTNWEKASTRLREMQVGLDRIEQLVTQLRNFSRLDTGRRETMSIADCVDSALLILSPRIDGTVDVVRDLRGPELIDCYPEPLQLVLINLLSNALDAVGGQGTIIISTELCGQDMTISVTDDGMGIPKDIQASIFDPFFTTKALGKGTGLGLSTSLSIAKKHGGTLKVASAVGQGTKMTLVFPLSLDRKE